MKEMAREFSLFEEALLAFEHRTWIYNDAQRRQPPFRKQYCGTVSFTVRKKELLPRSLDHRAGRDRGQEEKGTTEDGWDGWTASPTRWTWVWVNSGSWWWTGRPGVLWFMGSQRVGHDWLTELWWLKERLTVLWGHFSKTTNATVSIQ